MRRIIFVFLILTIFSCQKDDFCLTGNVKFSFINTGRTNVDEIHPQIFIIEDQSNPLSDILKVNSNGETDIMELNYGNYYLSYRIKYADNSYYIINKVFQVKVNKTTNVIVDFSKQ